MFNLKISGTKLGMYGIPVVLFFTLYLAFDFNGLYGQDSHAYYQYSKQLHLFFTSGIELGYFYWPKLYPFLGSIIGLVGLPILFGLQIVSLFSLLGAFYFTNKIITKVQGKDASLFLLFGAVLSAYFIRGGVLVMSDALATFLVMVCYYCFVLFFQKKRAIYFVLMVAFAGLAFFVRYPILPLVLIPILYSFFIWVKELEKYRIIIGLGIILCTALTIFLGIKLFPTVVEDFSLRWGLSNIFSNKFETTDGVIKHWVPNIIYVFGNFMHIGYLAIGVFLVPFYKNTTGINRIILVAVLVYLLFLSGFSQQNYRFLFPSHLLVIILLFPSFNRLMNWLSNRKIKRVFLLCALIFQLAFFIYSFGKTYSFYTNEKQIVKELKRMDSDAPIYSFYVDQSFPSYGVDNKVYNLYMEEYVEFQKNALVVFNNTLFKNQWKSTNVIKNWNKLTANYELEVLISFDNNWKIYQIK